MEVLNRNIIHSIKVLTNRTKKCNICFQYCANEGYLVDTIYCCQIYPSTFNSSVWSVNDSNDFDYI